MALYDDSLARRRLDEKSHTKQQQQKAQSATIHTLNKHNQQHQTYFNFQLSFFMQFRFDCFTKTIYFPCFYLSAFINESVQQHTIFFSTFHFSCCMVLCCRFQHRALDNFILFVESVFFRCIFAAPDEQITSLFIEYIHRILM